MWLYPHFVLVMLLLVENNSDGMVGNQWAFPIATHYECITSSECVIGLYNFEGGEERSITICPYIIFHIYFE